MINWQFYPKSTEAPETLIKVVMCFEKEADSIKSPENKLDSSSVLRRLRPRLEKIGFEVERGKKKDEKIHVPVLFGRNGKLEKYFEADAFHKDSKTVVEIEAGRGVTNYQFLKDLFQACMMYDLEYLCLAVRNIYRSSKDFEKVMTFFDTLYASGRLALPLKGVLVIGY